MYIYIYIWCFVWQSQAKCLPLSPQVRALRGGACASSIVPRAPAGGGPAHAARLEGESPISATEMVDFTKKKGRFQQEKVKINQEKWWILLISPRKMVDLTLI